MAVEQVGQWRLRSRWPSDRALQSLYERARGLGLSAPSTTTWLRNLRTLTQRKEQHKRREAARRLGALDDALAKQLRSDGYCRIESETLPGEGEALELCRRLATEARGPEDEGGDRNVVSSRKVISSILSGLEFLQYPALVDFLTSEPLVRAVAGYLGEIPWLTSAALVRTLPNTLEVSSQRFHFDHIDATQLKLFVAVEDVGPDCGPTACLSRADSEHLSATLGRAAQKRMKDESVFATVSRERLQVMTGPRGFSYLIDTCRCAHYGSRGNKRERLILMVNYNQVVVPRAIEDSAEAGTGGLASRTHTLTPLQQMVLRLIPK